MIPLTQVLHGITYHCIWKPTGEHCVATFHGRNGIIDRVKGTDSSSYQQSPHDYEVIEAVVVPASVLDVLSTARVKTLAGSGA